jgi:hypothetical protein
MGLMTPPVKNLLLGNHAGGQDPHKVVASAKKKIIIINKFHYVGPTYTSTTKNEMIEVTYKQCLGVA